MIAPGRITLQSPRRTFVLVGGNSVPGWELHFSIDGQGDYVAYLPQEGLTQDKIDAAITAAAEPWIATFDKFRLQG